MLWTLRALIVTVFCFVGLIIKTVLLQLVLIPVSYC